MIRLYSDAAVKGHSGLAAIGILWVEDGRQNLYAQKLEGSYDNHQAEFLGAIQALKLMIEAHKEQEIIFYHSDSKIVVDSLKKSYVKQVSFRPLLSELQLLVAQFSQLYVQWIPERENRGADQLARQALQKG